MATLISAADGNWTAVGTWNAVASGTGASQTNFTGGSQNTGTSYAASATFTLTNTEVLDGVLMAVKRNNTTGTVTIGLSDDNGSTWIREVTINASDLPQADGSALSLVFFKFGSSYTADGGSDYKLSFKSSSAGNATFYRSGTANDWFRVFRRTTNPGSLAAGDVFFVTGENTGAGAVTSRTVTMNNADATAWGNVYVCNAATLAYGVAASTNYQLKLSGDLFVFAGGTFTIGTTAFPIPATSTALLFMNCGSNVQYGIKLFGGTWHLYGASRSYMKTFLAADAAANATSLTSSDSTGWLDNDEICIAATTRTWTEAEKGALNGNASGTSLTVDGFGGVSGGVQYAHSGTSPTRAELGLLTHNVVVRGASASLQTYMNVYTGYTIYARYAQFYWWGSNSASAYGFDLTSSSGGDVNSIDIRYCSFHNFDVSSSRFQCYGNASTSNSIQDCVFYAISVFWMSNMTSGATFSNNLLIRCNTVYFGDPKGTFTNNTIACVGTGNIWIGSSSAAATSFNGNTFHSCNGSGLSIDNLANGFVIQNLTCWRNNGYGVHWSHISCLSPVFDGILLFGNNNANFYFNRGTSQMVIKNGTIAGDTTFSTARGIDARNISETILDLRLESLDIGVASGIYAAHSTCDIDFNTYHYIFTVWANNVNLGHATLGVNTTNLWAGNLESKIEFHFQKWKNTAGSHRSYYEAGLIETDSAIYKTAAPAERLTPKRGTASNAKLKSGVQQQTVSNGSTATFTAWVRKSASADPSGADYNGNQPRLVLKANPAAGISADVVLATMSAALGTWQQLSGTTAAVTDNAVLEAYVDCDGNAGWVNVDDKDV